jgi:hypothetical protein
MISFRLYESHGRIVLLESLETDEAEALLRSFGATDADMVTPETRKAFFRNNASKYHPDKNPGDNAAEQKFKTLSAAIDTLKSVGRIEPVRRASPTKGSGVPPWQTEPNATGSYNDVGNDNANPDHFKRHIWEISGESTEKYKLMAFDGSSFRDQIMTVFGSEHVFKEMAEAMITWNTYRSSSRPTKAVFVMREGYSELFLIYVGGHFIDPMFIEDFENGAPEKDASFLKHLPKLLQGIMSELG